MARNQWGKVILWIAGLKLSIKGQSELDFSQPRIYVANHSSYMDIPCLFAGLPVNLYFIAKAEVKKIPFVGIFMMATKMIFLDRGSRQKSINSMNSAGELIKKGKSVLVFPEGTRSRTGSLQTFKKGAFMLAYNSGLSVVPVHLEGTNHVMPSDSLSIKPGKVQMTIGTPISSSDFSDVQSFMDSTKASMLALKEG
ncbi:MAG: lysophospholipid acyltransferase family protein [Cytophagales bacterium]|nr:lysophospholipid acyltransferase family protein [Cytophagales bacterium]